MNFTRNSMSNKMGFTKRIKKGIKKKDIKSCKIDLIQTYLRI